MTLFGKGVRGGHRPCNSGKIGWIEWTIIVGSVRLHPQAAEYDMRFPQWMSLVHSAVAVCCAHGRRACLRAAVRGGARGGGAGAVLSLEEVLAEGAAAPPARHPTFTKQQQRALHDAMYCAAETDHLGETIYSDWFSTTIFYQNRGIPVFANLSLRAAHTSALFFISVIGIDLVGRLICAVLPSSHIFIYPVFQLYFYY